MGLFDFGLAVLAGTIGTAVFSMLSKMFHPRDPDGASLAALEFAIKLLPHELRRDRGEEWLAYMLEFEPGIKRYRQALTLPLAASVIRTEMLAHTAVTALSGAISFSGNRMAEFGPKFIKSYLDIVIQLAEKLAAISAELKERKAYASVLAFGVGMAAIGASVDSVQELLVTIRDWLVSG